MQGDRTERPDRSTVATAGFIFPLATIQEVRAELDVTDRQLDRMGQARIVDLDRWLERRDRLTWWRGRIVEQLAAMEAVA